MARGAWLAFAFLLAAGEEDYFSTESIIRRKGFACLEVTATRDEGTSELGRVFRVMCDGRHRYLLVYPPNRPSYVVVDRP
jgi:hypothetical protein